jgi:tetratricopeptide (TPR) repeat protein
MKLARISIGAALIAALLVAAPAAQAGKDDDDDKTPAEVNALPEQCAPQVDCDEVTDPKLHRRSGKSYWGVATKKRPPEMEVLEKCKHQLELAYCGLPDDWEVNMFLGMVNAEFEQFECAGQFFTRAIQLADSKKHRKRAADNRDHYWVEQYNEALELYNDEGYNFAAEKAELAVQLNPDDCRGLAILGSARAAEGNYAEAVEWLEKGLDMCPDKESIRDNLFIAYRNRGNEVFNEARSAEQFAEAAEWYGKADLIRDDDIENLYYYGVSCLQVVQRGDTTHVECARDAIHRFTELADNDEDRKVGLYNKALLDMEIENWEEANAAADRLIDLDPLSPDGYALKARILVKLDRAQEAELFIVLNKALETGPIEDKATWCDGAGARYGAGTDLVKQLEANGCPDHVYVYTDTQDRDMIVTVYAKLSRGFAFYHGDAKGDREVKVTPQ